MPNFQIISKATHADKRWKRHVGYAFTAADTVTPLTADELSRAVLHLPIALMAQGEGFVPVAVQGLAPGKNLFVAPSGQWLAGYVPAAYRGYPFALASTDQGQTALCFDASSGLMTENEGEAFFNEDGTPAQAVRDVLDFLAKVQGSREATARCCAILHRHQLIQPWPIQVQAAEGERTLAGLFRIDEAALNALSADAFEEVRRAGALPLAYCQLLSMQHLPKLGQLAQQHEQAAQPPQLPVRSGELDLAFLSNEGTISFGSL